MIGRLFQSCVLKTYTICVPDRGVANVCDLQKPNPQDIAAARLLSGGTVGKVVVFTTQLLKDTRTDVLGMLKVPPQLHLLL